MLLKKAKNSDIKSDMTQTSLSGIVSGLVVWEVSQSGVRFDIIILIILIIVI